MGRLIGFALAPALIAAAGVFVGAPTASADHPSQAVAGSSEAKLRAFETKALGPGHAADHAAQRGVSRRTPWAQPAFSAPPLTAGLLAGGTGAYTDRQSLQAAAAEPDPRATGGAWGAPFSLPTVGIHAALLPTGKVLWHGQAPGNSDAAVLWDPATGALKRVDPPLWLDPGDGRLKPANIFCSGQALLADGRVLVMGGNLGGRFALPHPGLNKVYTFNPFDETWTEQPDMPHGRWYPSQVQLPDGRQVIMSGNSENGSRNHTIEVFTPSRDLNGKGALTTLVDANGAPAQRGTTGQPPEGGFYPHLQVMPSGKTLVAGPEAEDSWYLHTPGSDNAVAWSDVANSSRSRTGGNVALEPPAPGQTAPSGKVVQMGGYGSPDDRSVASAEAFDESSPDAGWQPQSSLQVARSHQNTVLLPDGSMVAVGGGIGTPLFDSTAAHKQVELFDPMTRSWSLGAAQAETRAYHSTAVLLPDGRVVSAGDNINNTVAGATDTAEIYEPPYLFKGARPTIGSAPTSVKLGASFAVETSDANIDRAVLIAPSATTHANDMHQRYVPLELSNRTGGVELKAPASPDAAPPGYYMLFLVNDQGVPSIAKFIRLESLAKIPPDTAVSGGPTGPSNDPPTFTLSSSDDPGATFECSLDSTDDADFADCTSPYTLATLPADGPHILYVRATDSVGTVDPSPAAAEFTVDTQAPALTIDSGPAEGASTGREPQFAFSSSTDPGRPFECSLDSAVFTACSTPTTLDLDSGPHTFRVRVSDAAGNLTELSRSFTVDATQPETTILSGPSGPTNDTTPAFAYSSPDPGSFQCSIDGAAFGACSPAYGPFANGTSHSFKVRAIDSYGNVDSTPAQRSFTIDTTPPDTAIVSGPAPATNDRTPTFNFAAPGGASYQCRLDGGSFAACSSPRTLGPLADGSHSFQVRARDPAGNVEPAPAFLSFRVDTLAPDAILGVRPAALTRDRTPTFGFSSNEPGASFLCVLNATSLRACSSPRTLAPLGDGRYVFAVVAQDAAGNVKSSVRYAFTVDATAPSIGISRSAIRVSRHGKANVALRCPAAEPFRCGGTLTLRTAGKVTYGGRRRFVTFGSNSFLMDAGYTKPVGVALSKAEKALIRRAGSVRLRATVNGIDTAGNRKTLVAAGFRLRPFR